MTQARRAGEDAIRSGAGWAKGMGVALCVLGALSALAIGLSGPGGAAAIIVIFVGALFFVPGLILAVCAARVAQHSRAAAITALIVSACVALLMLGSLLLDLALLVAAGPGIAIFVRGGIELALLVCSGLVIYHLAQALQAIGSRPARVAARWPNPTPGPRAPSARSPQESVSDRSK